MKKMILSLSLLLLTNFIKAQILHPVKWAYAAKATGKNEATLFLKAIIESPWHIYSIHQKDGGPDKTTFKFTSSPSYELIGEMSEPTPITHYEKSFEMDVSYFESSVIFQQKVKLKPGYQLIKGTLHYMVCNDQKCLPPEDVDFSIPIK
jgi:hypothetical protein